MPARGIHLFKGKEPLLRQLIFELRYRFGFTYLDKCGKILNRMSRENPEWVIGNEISPQGAPLYSMRNRCRFTFSTTKLDLILDNTIADDGISEEEREEFVRHVDTCSRLTIDELGLKDFSRIGLRAVYYFQCDSRQESEEWLKSLELFSVSPKMLSAFNGSLDAAGLSAVIIGPDCRYRVAFNGVEISAQLDMGAEVLTVRESGLTQDRKAILVETLKARRRRQVNSGFAVVVDIDAYHEDPPSPNPGDFARRNAGKFVDVLRSIVS